MYTVSFLKVNIKNSIKLDKNKFNNIKINSKPVFKYTFGDSNYVINCFLDAMKNNSFDDAKVYISKNYVDSIDLNKFKNGLEGKYNLTYPLIKAKFLNTPKNCKENTMLVFNKNQKNFKLIHIQMLREVDKFGKWKIYNIEEESI